MTEHVDYHPRRTLFARLLNPKWAIPALMMLAIVLAPILFRTSHVAEVPEIGDPFDVKAFCSVSIPDEENAYTLYRQAAAKLTREPAVDDLVYPLETQFEWKSAPPEMKKWLDDNRAVLEIWRQGSERPQARYIQPNDYSINTLIEVVQSCRSFARMGELEVTRLEAEGNWEGAWDVNRAMFRLSRHVGQNGCMIERLVGMAIHTMAIESAVGWAANEHVTEQMLQRALADVRSIYAASEPISTSIKIEYLALQNTLKEPLTQFYDLFQVPWKEATPVLLFLRGEPELGRRVIQHWFANALEKYADAADKAKIPPHLSPSDLRPIMANSLVATALVPAVEHVETALKREQTWQAAFEMVLAAQIYYRKHGRFPEKAEQLIGSEFSAIPADPFAAPGQSMQYRFDEKTGEVVIWSVGENGINDGGAIDTKPPTPLRDYGYQVRPPAKDAN